MPSDLVLTQTPAIIPGGVPPPAPTAPAPARPFDPDDYDYEQAQALVAAEEAGTPPPATPTPRQAPRQLMPTAPRNGDKAQIQSLKRTLAEREKQLRLKTEESVYFQGALAARSVAPVPTGPGQPTLQPVPAQPDFETLMRTQGQIILDASKKFDEGEMTMVQFKEVELRAADVIAELRANHLLNHIEANLPRPQQDSIGLSDAQLLESHVEEMAEAHPWSAVLSERELGLLAGIARAEAAAFAKPIGKGPAETLRLRQAVAELADQMGPRWYPDGHPDLPADAPAAVPAAQPATAPRATVPAPRTTPAAATRALAIASRQPPNMSQAGYTETASDLLTDAKIETMSEDELLALPPSVFNRLRDQQ